MYTCLQCYDTFLFQPEICPTCAAQKRQKDKSKRAQERRASYDLSGQIAEVEFWQLLKWYRGCPCCGRSWQEIGEAISQDHIIPISRGGVHQVINLQPLCLSCNLWKSDRLIMFDPALPGQAVALPQRLHDLFKRCSHYQLLDLDSLQLEYLELPEVAMIYPYASAEQLQQRTIQLTWQAIG
jgi:hypothetical protein